MEAKCYLTTFKNKCPQETITALPSRPDEPGQELGLINLYPEMKYQTVGFFGGAITEAVGVTLAKLPGETVKAVIASYFSPDGLGYRAIRTHIDSCDFSLEGYSAVTDPEDTGLRTFSLAHDQRYIIPYIKMACEAAGESLPVMLSPWSPPAFMKTNGARNGGGKLRPECYGLWARYLCRYIQEYRAQGVNVTALSVQNEPNATQTWDSCLFSAGEERDFLVRHLHPALLEAGLGTISVFIWDHNKERLFDRACAEIDSLTDPMVAGLAFHWYSGDHFDALRLVREKFPDKQLVFSEGCIEYSRFDTDQLRNAQMYAHDMLGNFRGGMNSFLDWNIALDETGGPNHAGNYCEAPVICDTRTGEAEYKLSHRYIGHFSRFVQPGARRIGTTHYSGNLEVVAFENPDGSLAVLLLNRTARALPAVLRVQGRLFAATIEGESIATIRIH